MMSPQGDAAVSQYLSHQLKGPVAAPF
jgi:hypothetical protein